MSQEIVFTSAKRGLRAGSTGFCTVRSTTGMPQNLATQLEELTGYNHAVDPYDRSLLDRHPVNFVHYVTRLGGQRLHILGRIANAALDHTGRSNKLAHLIAFDETELNFSETEGPAAEIAAFRARKLFVSAWLPESEPVRLPDSRRMTLPQARLSPPQPCQTWKDLTGDAGWAGALAETARRRGKEPVAIIFSSEQAGDCLTLVVEALSLLPPHERWEVSFSTYFSGTLPTKVECHWQFLLDGSELARKARRNPRGTVIDLQRLQGERLAAPASELATDAASVTRSWLRGRETAANRVRSGSVAPETYAVPSFEDRSPETFALDWTPPRMRKSHRWFSLESSLPRPWLLRPSVWLAALVLIGIGVGGWWYQSKRSRPPDDFEQIAAASDQRSAKQRRLPNRIASNGSTSSPPDHAESRTADRSLNSENVEVRKPVEIASAKVAVRPAANVTPSNNSLIDDKPMGLPFDGIRKQGKQLEIELPAKGLQATGRPAGATLLAKIDVVSPADCELHLIGGESVLKPGVAFEITSRSETNLREWHVAQKSKGIGAPTAVGRFSLRDGELHFDWDRDNKNDFGIVNCLLSLKAKHRGGVDEVQATLRMPDRRPPLRLRLETPAESETLLIGSLLSNLRNLKLTCRFDGLPDDHRIIGGTELRIGDAVTIETHRAVKMQRRRMFDLKFSFQQGKSGDVVLHSAIVLHGPVLEQSPVRLEYKPREFRESEFIDVEKSRDKWKGELLLEQERVALVIEQLKSQAEKIPVAKKKQLVKVREELLSEEKRRELLGNWLKELDETAEWLAEVKTLRGELKQNFAIQYELKLEAEYAVIPLAATANDAP